MHDPRILVVEDEYFVAASLRSCLEAEGFEVEVASSVERACARLDREPSIDLVTLDLRLPDGDGFAVARHIAESQKATPIVIISALDDRRNQLKGFEEGATDYIVKPSTSREIALRVRNVLRRTFHCD